MAMDKGKVTVLTLLDLSAAFDTIDHSILLDRLQKMVRYLWLGIKLDFLLLYFYGVSLLGTAKFKGAYKSVNLIHMPWALQFVIRQPGDQKLMVDRQDQKYVS